MPLTKNSSHLIHEGITKHTWSPNQDTTRYQATGSATYKRDAFCPGDTADTPHISEYTYQLGDPQVLNELLRHCTNRFPRPVPIAYLHGFFRLTAVSPTF